MLFAYGSLAENGHLTPDSSPEALPDSTIVSAAPCYQDIAVPTRFSTFKVHNKLIFVLERKDVHNSPRCRIESVTIILFGKYI